MLKIGVTGGIGVGKTYVSNIIEKMGYPVFYADQTAKDLVKSDYKLIESIKKEFGHDIFLNEKIDSKKLSNIVFGDSNALNKLNSIIHPFVFEKFAEWCKNQKNQKIVFKEAAILFESRSHLDLDKVICVSADKKIRIDRIKLRDGRSENEINQIISKQMDQQEKEKLSDFIIKNNGKESILLQLTNILNKLE